MIFPNFGFFESNPGLGQHRVPKLIWIAVKSGSSTWSWFLTRKGLKKNEFMKIMKKEDVRRSDEKGKKSLGFSLAQKGFLLNMVKLSFLISPN